MRKGPASLQATARSAERLVEMGGVHPIASMNIKTGLGEKSHFVLIGAINRHGTRL